MINVGKYFRLVVRTSAGQSNRCLALSSWSFICYGSLNPEKDCYLFVRLGSFEIGESIITITGQAFTSPARWIYQKFDRVLHSARSGQVITLVRSFAFLADEISLFLLDPFNDPLPMRRKQGARFLSARCHQGVVMSFLFSPVLMKKVIVIWNLFNPHIKKGYQQAEFCSFVDSEV